MIWETINPTALVRGSHIQQVVGLAMCSHASPEITTGDDGLHNDYHVCEWTHIQVDEEAAVQPVQTVQPIRVEHPTSRAREVYQFARSSHSPPYGTHQCDDACFGLDLTC